MPETFDMVGSVREAIDTLIVPRTILDKPDASELQVSRGAVHFDKIDFAYDNGTVVFDKLDLAIPAGQRVGLVGISGSGKTTLTSLLLRLYDIQGGQILIDGQAIHDVGQDSLRRAIGIIPQDSQLFHRSIMDNIRYGRLDATDDEVFEAAKRAHAYAFVKALPKGYDTLVGERGIKLSGGQRQRPRRIPRRTVLRIRGSFVSDASLIALGYLFAGQLDLLNTHRDIMGWVGGSVLIIFGVVQMTRQPKAKEVDDDRRTVHGHYLVRGFLMNTLNPMVLLFWLSVIGIVSLREQYSLSDRFTFFGSVLGTVLSTDLLKSYGAGKLKRLLNAQVMKWINRITGLIVAGFGLEMIVRAFLQS